MIKHGVAHAIHYLDDFLFLGPPDSLVCQQSVTKALAICQNLGVPVAMHKCEGPATTLTFLGIELDTIEMEMRLPLKKLSRLQEIITSWRQKKSCLRKDLESLVGHLCHACKVVRPGRRFLRGMFQLLTNCKRKHYFIRLSCAFRADLEWWHFFLASWNGSSMLFTIKAANPGVHVWSDASGSWGATAWCQGAWFQVIWQDFPQFEGVSIAAKELLPIVVGAAAWGSKWGGKTVCFHCENAAVVAVLKGGYTKEPYMAHMLRCLFFLEASMQFVSIALHVPGVQNEVADALSRNNMSAFFRLAPQSNSKRLTNPTGTAMGRRSSRTRELDLSALENLVHFYTKEALAPATRRAYSSAQRRYLSFCTQFKLNPIPTSESILCAYVAFLAKDNVKYKSIKMYLSAIRNLQIVSRHRNLFSSPLPLLEQVLNGIKKNQAKGGATMRHRERLPITPDILYQMLTVWKSDSQNPDVIMMWAACCTCFFGFLRTGEITLPSQKDYDSGAHLSFGDVKLDAASNPTRAEVSIKSSKTDPFRHGVVIHLGKTDNALCPVVALASYLAI